MKKAGISEFQDRKKIANGIFNRSTRERQAMDRTELLHGDRGLRLRILDSLGFVDDGDVKLLSAKFFDIRTDRAVRRNHEIGFSDFLSELLTPATGVARLH